MISVDVTAQTKKVLTADGKPTSTSFKYNFPENVEEAVREYNHDLVYSTFYRQMKTDLEGKARILIEKGYTPEQIQQDMSGYVFGEKRQRVVRIKEKDDRSTIERINELSAEEQRRVFELMVAQFPPDQRAAILAALASNGVSQSESTNGEGENSENSDVGTTDTPARAVRRATR